MLRATLPSLSRQSTIGWIGLGAMGAPMATNLFTKTYLAHQQLPSSSSFTADGKISYLICESDDHRVQAFLDQLRKKGGSELISRVERVNDGREMALAASRILTMLPSTPQVEAVYLDSSTGILAGLSDLSKQGADPGRTDDSATGGDTAEVEFISTSTSFSPRSSRTTHTPPLDSSTTISPSTSSQHSTSTSNAATTPNVTSNPHTLLIDHTTLDPTAAIRIAAQVHQSTLGQAIMLDAPVSGGTVAAVNGLLTIMLGSSSPAATAAVRPLLKTMAREGGVIECGANGAGVGVKVCNNLILAINQIALAEGLALGRSLGIDPLLLHDVINTSSGQSWSSRMNTPLSEVPASPGSRGYSGGFQSRLMLKDIGLALSAAHAYDLPTPLTWAAKSVYQAVCEENEGQWATKDFSVVYEWLKKKQDEGVERGWKDDPTST